MAYSALGGLACLLIALWFLGGETEPPSAAQLPEPYTVFDPREVKRWPEELYSATRVKILGVDDASSLQEARAEREQTDTEGRIFQSYGPLERELKNSARRELLQSLEGLQRQMGRAHRLAEETGEPDLLEEGAVAIAMQQRRAQLELLESDDYITVDSGVTLFQFAPEGFSIITYLVRIPDSQGRAPDAIFILDHERFPGIALAEENRRNVEMFIAEEAAFAFNSLDHEQRRESINTLDALRAENREASSENEKDAMSRFGGALRYGLRYGSLQIDRTGFLLINR